MYLDDAVVALVLDDPWELLHGLDIAACAFSSASEKSGLLFNWKAGKTEAIVALRGPGKSEAESSCEVIDGVATMALGNGERLRLVDVYKHVGTQTNAMASLTQDAAYRVSTCRQAPSIGRHNRRVRS